MSEVPEGRVHEIVTDREALRKPCDKFDFANPPMDPMQLAADLVRTMIDHNGLGLSANQIGFPYRVFAMRTAPQNTVVFNPILVNVDPETETLEEGCLSFPGMVVKIKRHKLIKVRFAYPNGEVKNELYKDLTARVFQHELDHLNGKIFYEQASRFHREQAERKAAKYQRYLKRKAA
jgi:peptide deformylase